MCKRNKIENLYVPQWFNCSLLTKEEYKKWMFIYNTNPDVVLDMTKNITVLELNKLYEQNLKKELK